ncbi:hypothetical protein-transmembrane prediction [Rhodopirellula baltica SH 1]|uniref:Uncharacterized protein n=1 Tax=Rhodopirellula baltica (strain DSM 10527 / NCIMB 13988 / SH1) TaxID=243090 RepID=Q7UYC0_RHOBA|nr:hypothetical protein-transmembrane prediction [Rhodopirellula baltica SH 1]
MANSVARFWSRPIERGLRASMIILAMVVYTLGCPPESHPKNSPSQAPCLHRQLI